LKDKSEEEPIVSLFFQEARKIIARKNDMFLVLSSNNGEFYHKTLSNGLALYLANTTNFLDIQRIDLTILQENEEITCGIIRNIQISGPNRTLILGTSLGRVLFVEKGKDDNIIR
jgi:hypothetical protein